MGRYGKGDVSGHDPSEDKLVCDNCGRDTFAIGRDDGLEVKYRDRWVLILNDTVGTVLFRCRFCNGVKAYHLNRGVVRAVAGEAHPSR